MVFDEKVVNVSCPNLMVDRFNQKIDNRYMGMFSKNRVSVMQCVLLNLLLMSFVLCGCAGQQIIRTSQTYYSVHLESFRELKNANRYVNDLTHKGKFVFWKIAHVEGVRFHRVFVGRFSDRTEAEAYRLNLRDEFAVKEPNKPLKIHEFHETLQGIQSQSHEPQPPTQPDRHD